MLGSVEFNPQNSGKPYNILGRRTKRPNLYTRRNSDIGGVK